MTLSRRARQTRQAILDAARDCFAEMGLSGASTREIARRAGVTQPLINHYFGSKEGLFEAVVEASLAEYEQVQAAQWALPPGDLRFFTTGLVVLFRWLGEQPHGLRLAAWARLEGQPGVVGLALPVYRRVRAQLLAARSRGLVRPDVDVDGAILMIDAMFKGFWDRRAEYAGYPIADEALPERMLRTAVETLLRGLLQPDVHDEALSLFAAAFEAHMPGDDPGDGQRGR